MLGRDHQGKFQKKSSVTFISEESYFVSQIREYTRVPCTLSKVTETDQGTQGVIEAF